MSRLPAGQPRPDGADPYRPPYGAAAIAALLVWLLYAVTLAPTTWFWDTSEYITVSHILGVPHPPGNPLFVLLARAWELLLAPFGLSVAVRINLFSATMSALAHGCWFLVAHRILSFGGGNRAFRLAGAAAATLISATAFTVWNQSNVNEKVYTVSFATIALVSWLLFRWRDRGDTRFLVLIAYLLVLSIGNHLMAFLAAPALLLGVLLIKPHALLDRRLYLGAAGAAALALSVHAFLPVRAGLDPIINEGDPRCESAVAALESIYTFGKAPGCEALSAQLNRSQYGKPPLSASPIDPRMPRDAALVGSQIGNYLQYFDWQWGRSVAGLDSVFGGARPLVTLLFLALGIWGAAAHYRQDRVSWVYLTVLFGTLSLGLVLYMNFRHGFSLRPDMLPGRESEVRDRDYFFLVSFSLWGVWAGIGVAALWRWLAERTAAARPGAPAYALTAPVLALALIPLALNWSWASRAGDYAARDWAYNLLQSVEPYGVLFTNGDNDTFPLWYLQEVEGIRKDVTVIVTTYLNTPWYAKQIRQLTAPCPAGINPDDDPTRILCQRPFRPEGAPAVYAASGTRQPPEDSILQLTDEEIEAMAASAFIAPRDLLLRAGNLQTTIPQGTMLAPSDTFVSAILAAVLGERPVHFTPQQTTATLGLTPYLVRQGLAYKLNDGPVRPDAQTGVVPLPAEVAPVTGRFVNLPVTDTLLREVFVHRSGIPDEWEFWVDTGSRGNIPRMYAYAHLAAAQAHALLGAESRARQHMERAERWVELTGEAD